MPRYIKWMTQPANPILDIVRQYRAALARHDAVALNRLTSAYTRLYARLKDKIELLADAIGSEAPTTGQLVRMTRYTSLIRQVESELRDYQVILRNEIGGVSQEAIALAGRDSARLVQLIAGQYGVRVEFNRLPKDAIETLLGFLSEDGPLYARISKLAGANAQSVAEKILEGVGLGKNPRAIAADIRDSLGGGLTDALRMTRTAQNWAYRETARANYINNNDVVQGWTWFADLAGDPCMACIAQHGTVHGLDETLDDHFNGRCTPVPLVVGLPNPVEQGGEEWFNGLTESKQKELMGQSKFEAWKDNQFSFGQLAAKHENDVYGQMTIEAPLGALIGE